MPKLFPFVVSAEEPAIKLSLGAVLIPYPTLSVNRTIRTCSGEVTIENNGDSIAVNAYSMIIKGLFLPILSLHQPDNALRTEAVLSAIPSINEISVFVAPKVIKNNGMIA